MTPSPPIHISDSWDNIYAECLNFVHDTKVHSMKSYEKILVLYLRKYSTLHYFICLKVLELWVSDHGKKNAKFTTTNLNYPHHTLNQNRITRHNQAKANKLYEIRRYFEIILILVNMKLSQSEIKPLMIHLYIFPFLIYFVLSFVKAHTIAIVRTNCLITCLKNNFLALCQAKCWVSDEAPNLKEWWCNNVLPVHGYCTHVNHILL